MHHLIGPLNIIGQSFCSPVPASLSIWQKPRGMKLYAALKEGKLSSLSLLARTQVAVRLILLLLIIMKQILEKKEEIWLSPMTTWQHKNFDYTTISDRLRTVNWMFEINLITTVGSSSCNSFNVRCTLVLAFIQRSYKHFRFLRFSYFACTCTRQYADINKTPLLKPHHTNMHLNTISHFLPFGALRLLNGPLKLEMSHWNKIEGAIWHIEKKVIPIPVFTFQLICIRCKNGAERKLPRLRVRAALPWWPFYQWVPRLSIHRYRYLSKNISRVS